MKTRNTIALGALALGWLAGPVVADPPKNVAPAAPGTIISAPAYDMHAAPCCGASHDDSCGGSGGAFADLGIYWVKPYWRNHAAYQVSTGRFGNDVRVADNRSTTEDFTYDSDIAPRFTLGYVGCDGLGIRLRGWWYEDSATAVVRRGELNDDGFLTISTRPGVGESLFIGGAGSTLAVSDKVTFSAWDVDSFKRFEWGCCSVTFFGGLRYSATKLQYGALSRNGDTGQLGALRSTNDFEGIGPTVGYEVHCPCGSGLGLYQSTRLGYLYGHQEQIATRLLGPAEFIAANFARDSQERDTVQGQGELELGADWSSGGFFVQGAIVGLVYSDVTYAGISLKVGFTW